MRVATLRGALALVGIIPSLIVSYSRCIGRYPRRETLRMTVRVVGSPQLRCVSWAAVSLGLSFVLFSAHDQLV